MNISFDKAILWLIPYLYLVSVSYYWGYWGLFDIDAFNYYPASDLIKGVTSPIVSTLKVTCTILVITLIGRFIFAKLLKKLSIAWQILLIEAVFLLFSATIVVAVIISYKIYFTHNLNRIGNKISEGNQSLQLVFGPYMIFLFAGTLIAYIIESHLEAIDLYSFKYVLRSSGIYFLIILPGQAYFDGLGKAIRIKQGESFNYTIADAIVSPQKKVYKYLGKAGDYHFLLTTDNTKYIIIPTDKLIPLIIENFQATDTSSTRRYKQNIESILSAARETK